MSIAMLAAADVRWRPAHRAAWVMATTLSDGYAGSGPLDPILQHQWDWFAQSFATAGTTTQPAAGRCRLTAIAREAAMSFVALAPEVDSAGKHFVRRSPPAASRTASCATGSTCHSRER